MAYRKIEEILINGNSGEIFDSYIYGSNLELGFSESPTKLTLNIVKKDNTDFDSFPTSLITSYEIKIGALTLSKMYLYSYEISRSVGQKTATLNFIDPSFILDKIFVGLIHRHFSPANITLTVSEILTGQEDPSDLEILQCSLYVDVDLKKGGSIMLGKPQYIGDSQDTPDIAYNFTELLAGISKAGFNISGLVDINSNYFQPYVGTLREVLSNWCADFGYTFYWDVATNSIKGIDLKIDVDFINEIKSIITTNSALNVNVTNENTLAIESFNEGLSLEGTVTQKHISRYMKPSKGSATESTTTSRKTFTCIKPEDLGVVEIDVLRSVLGKYSTHARRAYCILQKDFAPIGYTAMSQFEDILPNQVNDNLFTQILDQGFNNPEITNYIKTYDGARIFIGIFDPEKEQQWLDWESQVADMIGKYYHTEGGFKIGPNVVMTPAGEYYTSKQKYDVPFSKVLEGPKEYNDSLKLDINNFYLFTRSNATYGQDQKDYDATMLDEYGEDYFAKYTLKPLDMKGVAYANLVGAKNNAICLGQTNLANKLKSIVDKIDELNNQNSKNTERRVVLVLAPREDTFKKSINVSFAEEVPNTKETKKNESDGNSYVGLQSTFARSIFLNNKSTGNSINLILPAENYYLGEVNISRTSTSVLPGQNIVYGKIGEIDDNTMALHVAESDITNDLDVAVSIRDPALQDINLNVIDPDSIGKGINAALSYNSIFGAQYHTELSKKIVNSITVPRKNINLSVIGLNYGDLSNYFSQAKGLNSLSINLNENGATSQITFANRPKVLPKKEALSQKIQPRIKLATFRP